MRSIFIAFLFLCLIYPQQLKAQTKDSAEGDYEALMELYRDLGGGDWHKNSGWGSGSVVTNDWYGVQVDADNRIITPGPCRRADAGRRKKGEITWWETALPPNLAT
ncbi:MAG: hypothetical protein U5K69_18860 [Balneolaceae bacterium]|nr:hypothetical protein [Balneolaceae bacterium]